MLHTFHIIRSLNRLKGTDTIHNVAIVYENLISILYMWLIDSKYTRRPLHYIFMFIPVDRKPDWRNPPFVTLLLILVNIGCYFIWQHNDDLNREAAIKYYFQSDLPSIEVPLYIDYLRQKGDIKTADELQSNVDRSPEYGKVPAFQAMYIDGLFLKQLYADKLITPRDKQYFEWLRQREHFDALMAKVVTYTYGLKTIEPTITTLFTSMFLHADAGHLWGNMLFLFLFGFVVELSMGRAVYVLSYLLAGLASGGFYILLDPNSAATGIGASGAISGLVGMYTVLFGLRKIRFFYTLLFYFDYVKAPAIILLPLWLGYETYLQVFSPSHINRFAHIGGLLGGAIIAFAAKKLPSGINYKYLDQTEVETNFRKDYDQGLKYVGAMEMDKAKAIFERLLTENPDNIDITVQLFNITKFKPAAKEFHQYANTLLNLPGSDRATVKILHDVYIDYISKTKPKVNADQLMSLAMRFASTDFIDDAEKIITYLIKNKKDFTRNPEGLMILAKNFRRLNHEKKSQQYLTLLLKIYPHSSEAIHAKQALA